ncbi:hypothetical protein DXG03_003820 [Asterophora parasitica]|uniref:GH18 domain-containing protein n=1 Tax=Asterophora parasitica TaxID=117018 RepID=A0A9P7G2Y0_9AGAR|nr:hypothetical protein DXG03_003820 [Asterophora parasitica]
MAYDIWGSWSSSVGPNAPLDDSCAASGAGSAASGVKAWTAAGFPANKARNFNLSMRGDRVDEEYVQIALGVASYGHSFHVDRANAFSSSGTMSMYAAFDKSQQPAGYTASGKEEPQASGLDQCGQPTAGGGVSGDFDFVGMINDGYLNGDGWPSDGIDYHVDNCSKTPYVYNNTTQVMIAYDDMDSFKLKGQFINAQGLKGFAMWHSVGDSNDILIDSISKSMGIEQICG